jgi:hypothetical protein
MGGKYQDTNGRWHGENGKYCKSPVSSGKGKAKKKVPTKRTQRGRGNAGEPETIAGDRQGGDERQTIAGERERYAGEIPKVVNEPIKVVNRPVEVVHKPPPQVRNRQIVNQRKPESDYSLRSNKFFNSFKELKPATHAQNILRLTGLHNTRFGRPADKLLSVGKQLGFGKNLVVVNVPKKAVRKVKK